MEVAGLALGVVATWKTCVQVFDMVGHSRSYGRDYEELSRVKLEVERIRLLAWGDAMGLSDTPGCSPCLDPRLNQQRTQQVVLSLLGSIQHIFNDTDHLRERYGLVQEIQYSDQDSSPSLQTWLRRGLAGLTRSARDRQRAASMAQRSIWVIRDRNKFARMVLDIRQLNDSLGHLFPDLSLREALRREFGRRREVPQLRLLQQASSAGDPDMSDIASQRIDELSAANSRRSTNSRASNGSRSLGGSSLGSSLGTSTITPPRGNNEAPQDPGPSDSQSKRPAEVGEAIPIDAGEAGVRAMWDRLEKFELKFHHGELKVSLLGPTYYSAKTTSFVDWQGIEHPTNWQFRHRGFVEPQHASFDLYRKKRYKQKLYRDKNDKKDNDGEGEGVLFDIESSPWYENSNPGTINVEGFALECWEYEECFGIPRNETVLWSEPADYPPIERLLRRLDELGRDTNKFPWDPAEDSLDLQDFLLQAYTTTSPDPIRHEIIELYKALNCSHIWIDFLAGALLSAAWINFKTNRDVLMQVILGKELGRRLQRCPEGWINGLTEEVLATLIMSDLWVQNVAIVKTPRRAPASLSKKPTSTGELATAERFKDEGNHALKRDIHREAVDLYTKALEIGGSNAIYICNRSAAHLCLERYDEALHDAWMAKELDPRYAKAWARLGAAQLKLGHLDPAVEAYETAVRLAGNSVTGTMKTGLEAARKKVREFNDALDKNENERQKHDMVAKLLDTKWSMTINDIKLHSRVQQSQVDGLLLLAEKMRWPYLNELRAVAEEAYNRLHSDGTTFNYLVVDWLYGLTLPGKYFAFKLMATLIQCSPSILAALGIPQHFDCNVVLETKSYWRVRSVLGRMLGPLPGVKSLGGWIGQCPAVSITPASGTPSTPMLVRLSARPIPTGKPLDPNDRTIYSGNRNRYKYTRPSPEEDLSAFFADMMSEDAYIVPQPPVKSLSTVTLESIKLKLSLKGTQSTPTTWQDAEYRASLVFSLDTSPELLTCHLYTNPVFITLPRCYDGPHAVHRRERDRFQCEPLEVEQLWGHHENEQEGSVCLVINATGEGAEVLARAWRCERGKHAVVVRGQVPCLVCALRCAEGLEVGIVIWVG